MYMSEIVLSDNRLPGRIEKEMIELKDFYNIDKCLLLDIL